MSNKLKKTIKCSLCDKIVERTDDCKKLFEKYDICPECSKRLVKLVDGYLGESESKEG